MIEYINARLNEWASWVKRRDDGGLGYPGAANFVKLVSVASTASSGPVVQDAAAMEIEGIITRMKQEKPERYWVAYWFYLAGDVTGDRIASELRCTRSTAYTRLHALHLDVMDALHDITIEAGDRAAVRNKNILKIA